MIAPKGERDGRSVMTTTARHVIAAVALLAAAAPAAADDVADFYKGKTVTLVVGHEPGTGFDVYARVLQRHLRRHIPGNPGVVVQNMSGVGGIAAANWLYNSAPRDGTVLSSFVYTVPFEPLMANNAARFDPTKFNWIGNMEEGVAVCGLSKAAGVATFEQMRTTETIIGGASINGALMRSALAVQQPLRRQDEDGGRLQGHRQHEDRDRPRRDPRRLWPLDVDHHLDVARRL